MRKLSIARFSKAGWGVVISMSLFLGGCGTKINDNTMSITPVPNALPTEEVTNTPVPADTPTPVVVEPVDLEKIKPNEAGKIMVVMFHNFVSQFTPSRYDKGEYTTTFVEFEKLLLELYQKDYRPISMSDYINNNISVEAGKIPIIFTFDDGTKGQFNLVEEDGKLVAGKDSAVGIMEKFNKEHPDFELRGTFYVNLGNPTFDGKGTLKERLKYLIDKGFDIGNHTYTHINLKEAKDKDHIQNEIGQNNKKMMELVEGYKMTTFSLPYGAPSKDLQSYVQKGIFEGVQYNNLAIMEVGWDPSLSPVSKNFNPFSTHRVRSSGINPVDADLAWWLKNLSRGEQYVSDGNKDTVTVPKSKEEVVDNQKLVGKKLITY